MGAEGAISILENLAVPDKDRSGYLLAVVIIGANCIEGNIGALISM
jgi:hypothetical protein